MIGAFLFFAYALAPVVGPQDTPACNSSSPWFLCGENGYQKYCKTFAILRANSRCSSLAKLSSYLGISPRELAEANGFSAKTTNFFSVGQSLLIPIECKCSAGGFFEADVRIITIGGESFKEIAESLEGLTSHKAIEEYNPRTSQWNLGERINLLVPLKCGCPSSVEPRDFLLSYPVREGDTLAELAIGFDVSVEGIVSANNRKSNSGLCPNPSLVPFSTLLIPAQGKPNIGFVVKPSGANFSNPADHSNQVRNPHKKTSLKTWMIGVYASVGVLLASIAIGAAFYFLNWKKKKKRRRRHSSIKNEALEVQQVNLGFSTTSYKKVPFQGSPYNFDDPIADTIPHKPVQNYTLEELQKATDGFSLSSLIEGSVYHGRLKGENLAIKCTRKNIISRTHFHLLHERILHHPNILGLLGTCVTEGPDSFIVLEYAKNGSLKDWIHGGLAIKSQFIDSCSCFLTWNQRLKICLDVVTALHYMHHTIKPSYVHRHVRSRNIFLDEEFRAKLGNFGMASCAGREAEDQESRPCPTAAWNNEYLAPEYMIQGTTSPSIDIYAYGLVLLEVLSGKPPIRRKEETGEANYVKLSDEINNILEAEETEEFRKWIDWSLGDNYSFHGAVTLANLARSCLEEDSSLRPTAGEIVDKLSRLGGELPEVDKFNTSEISLKPHPPCQGRRDQS